MAGSVPDETATYRRACPRVANMDTDKHTDIIRSRLDRLLRDLRAMPVLSEKEIAAAFESLLLELDCKESATAEHTGRAITLSALRDRLTDMPGAHPVFEAIDSAIAVGAE
jgi:hypothetical protein